MPRRRRVTEVSVSVCPICTIPIPIYGYTPVYTVDILHVSHPTIDIVNYIPTVHPTVHTWHIIHIVIHAIHIPGSFCSVEITVSKSTRHVTHATIHIDHFVSAVSSCAQWRVAEVGTVATQGHPRLLGSAGGNRVEAQGRFRVPMW